MHAHIIVSRKDYANNKMFNKNLIVVFKKNAVCYFFVNFDAEAFIAWIEACLY